MRDRVRSTPAGPRCAQLPRRLSALLYAGQFTVLQPGVSGLLMTFSYHAGFTR